MMEPLPFEQDRPELLEAASLALAAVMAHPAQPQPERARSPEPAPVYAVWQRESGDGAAVHYGPGETPEIETVFSRLDPAALSAGLSAEDLSREIERDARRFEAN